MHTNHVAPQLSMLWERTDPRAALARRFGYRAPDRVAEWLADSLAETW